MMKRVEPRTWAVLPFALCVFFVLGCIFALLTSTHHWGIAAILIMAGYIFLIGFVAVMTARLARVKSESVGFFMGLLLSIGYLAGEIVCASAVGRVGIAEWFSGRWTDGYELFGAGSYALKGWLWGAAYGSRVVFVAVICAVAMGMEGKRQFCERCKHLTTKTRWKSVVKRFDPEALSLIEKVKDLLELVPTPGAPEAVWLRVRTCRCGSLGEILVDRYSIEDKTRGSTMIEAVPLSAPAFSRVLEWVRGVDPSAEMPGDDLQLDQASEVGEQFDPSADPEGPQWDTLIRWDGAGTAMEWRCDTRFTRRLRRHLVLGQYQAIGAALGHVEDINDIACVYEAAGDWDRPMDWIEFWCEEQPESSVAHTVAGINLVKQAWIKRGSGWSPKNVPEFMGLLSSAMVELDIATELDEDNAIAWAWKIYAGKGLGQDNERVRSYFDAATAKHPDLHAAHWMYFDYLTPKWYGSEEECIGFAREVLRERSAGSPALATVVYAHFEIAREQMEQDKKNGFANYINRADVRSDILQANQRAFDGHRTSMVTPRVRAFFAYMLWQLGEHEEARRHMEIIGKSTHWDPFSPSVFFLSRETYRKARRACGL